MFVFAHGWAKLRAGQELWTQLGGAMQQFGITFAPTVWGALAMAAEFFGGMLFLLGVLFRPACFLLLCVMIVASTTKIASGVGPAGFGYPVSMGIVFLSMLIAGPGRLAVRGWIRALRDRVWG
jgi:putative oxidoreductase